MTRPQHAPQGLGGDGVRLVDLGRQVVEHRLADMVEVVVEPRVYDHVAEQAERRLGVRSGERGVEAHGRAGLERFRQSWDVGGSRRRNHRDRIAPPACRLVELAIDPDVEPVSAIRFTPSLVYTWIALPNGRPGGQRKYSDAVIELALALRLLFGLRWRQTEGFLASLLELMGLELDVPDHTTLSRRTQGLKVDLAPCRTGRPLQLVLDSTGLGVFGEGEWATAKWGGRSRRGWKKHVAGDDEGQIHAAALTEPTCTDPAIAPILLENVQSPIREVIADGAYDQRPVYQAIHERGARSVIPPSRSAKISGERAHRDRDAALERIEEVGRKQ